MQLLIEAIQGTAAFENVPTGEVTELHQVSTTDYTGIESVGQPQEAFATDELSVLDSFLACSAGMTTVMVRNVPRKCTQRMLLNDIILEGYGEAIDFVYLPTDISTGKNLGYSFVNFTHPYYAETFRKSFHKKHLSSMRGSRTGLSVSYAVIQGLEANISNVLKNASVHRIRNPEYLPLVRDNTRGGQLVPCVLKTANHSPTIGPMGTENRLVGTPLRAH
jgi:hypothetical protein